jgi:tRNA pseudouridine55 synthase
LFGISKYSSMTVDGLLVLDKPPGITSRDALDRAAKWFPRKTKIGHAGTLDPLATGVLVLAIGQATRLIEFVQAMPKAYRTRITLGATSDTDDADGVVTTNPAALPIDESVVRDELQKFIGVIEQTPPSYSAARVQGKRAHNLARQGEDVSLAPRKVRIDRIDLLAFAWPNLDLEVHCGKGTYIRSIARDLGAAIAVGGYVAELRRLRIGPFEVQEAVSLDADASTARARLLPMTAAVSDLRKMTFTYDQIRLIRTGAQIGQTGEGEVAAIDEEGELIAVGEVGRGIFQPRKVFA